MAASTSEATTCYRHPERETGVSCSNCGRPICTDCMTSTSVGMRCPECAKQTTKVVRAGSLDRQPAVTSVLIAINVIVFLGSMAAGSAQRGAVADAGALNGPAVAAGEYWRLITSGFLHGGLFHLLFNMYALYVMGGMLEPALGRARFIALYFTALLCGSAGALLLDPEKLTLGASGAVFGLFAGAFVALRARGFDPMATGIGPVILLNLAFTFLFPGLSIGGHLGGLLGGALAGLIIERLGARRRSPVVPVLACAALGALAIVGAIVAANTPALY